MKKRIIVLFYATLALSLMGCEKKKTEYVSQSQYVYDNSQDRLSNASGETGNSGVGQNHEENNEDNDETNNVIPNSFNNGVMGESDTESNQSADSNGFNSESQYSDDELISGDVIDSDDGQVQDVNSVGGTTGLQIDVNDLNGEELIPEQGLEMDDYYNGGTPSQDEQEGNQETVPEQATVIIPEDPHQQEVTDNDDSNVVVDGDGETEETENPSDGGNDGEATPGDAYTDQNPDSTEESGEEDDPDNTGGEGSDEDGNSNEQGNNEGDAQEEQEEEEEPEPECEGLIVEGELGRYVWGQLPDLSNLKVSMIYSNGMTEEITEYTIDMNYPALYKNYYIGNMYKMPDWMIYAPGIYEATVYYGDASAQVEYTLMLMAVPVHEHHHAFCTAPGVHPVTVINPEIDGTDKISCDNCWDDIRMYVEYEGGDTYTCGGGRVTYVPLLYDYTVTMDDLISYGMYTNGYTTYTGIPITVDPNSGTASSEYVFMLYPDTYSLVKTLFEEDTYVN